MKRQFVNLVRASLQRSRGRLCPISPALSTSSCFSVRTLVSSSYRNSPSFPPRTFVKAVQLSSPLLLSRSLCSSSDPSNIVLIKSEDQFNSTITKVQGESLPAIFYFTAVWCGPCKFISPTIIELSKKYPHVTTYKIDIDQEGLEAVLRELSIFSVPTLHFYKKGKKAAEIVGADVARLKTTMESLYKQEE